MAKRKQSTFERLRSGRKLNLSNGNHSVGGTCTMAGSGND
jgi:hypothetical protein